MVERRSLTEGLTMPANDRGKELEFIQGAKSSNGTKAMKEATSAASGVSLNTRIHPDIFAAVKRMSLERKLQGIEPNSIRDILEQALEPWLRGNGYLP